MKRLFAILLICTLSLSFLTACGEDTRSRGEKVTDGVSDVIDGLLGD